MTAQPPGGGGDLPPRPPAQGHDGDGAPPPPPYPSHPGHPEPQQPAPQAPPYPDAGQYPPGSQYPAASQYPPGAQYPPAGEYPAGPPAPWAEPKPPLDAMSVTAFVCGLLGILVITIPVAIVLGIVGFVRTKGKKRRGRIFAVLGIVAALLWAALIGAIVAVAVLAGVDRDEDGNVQEETSMNVFDVEPGDCLEAFDIDADQKVVVLPCAQPHGAQVITQFDLADGDWPGDEQVASQAESGCRDRIADVLGTRVDEGGLGLGYFHPEESSWDVGDRTVLCLVTAEGGAKLTETFNSAG